VIKIFSLVRKVTIFVQTSAPEAVMQSVSIPIVVFSGIIIVLGAVLSLVGILVDNVYEGNSASLIAQGKGQDLVTIMLAVPALIGALVFSIRGSMRAELAVAGLLGYFLYTYFSYAFLLEFNKWFLAYVAAFSCSLFSFVLILVRLTKSAPDSITLPQAPLSAGAILLILLAFALLFMWLSQLIPAMQGKSVRVIEESGGKPVIQALDLGIIVPAAIVIAIMAFRQNPGGVVWLTVFLVKGITMALAIVSMTIFMARAGTSDTGGAIVFSVFSALFIAVFIWLFVSMRVTSHVV
jgi:hypothetical protein